MKLDEGLLFADRYKFIKQLGRGGFSEVWLAEDNMTCVQIAIKIYAPGTGLDDNGIKIFTQEFSLVFDMNHTNLLRPTHFDCWERMPYLIMPLIKNGSAFNYLAEGKKISENECWKMIHDVAAGLAYLHDKKPPLIHQDIKPDNILIDDEGRYLITDFGISARVRSTIRGSQSHEQSGGTLAYMGPERFSATPKPIMASDIWSVGAMMYELMTGMPPFGNHGGVLQKNGADIPIIEEDFSQELKDIVYSCLAKETWDRPSAAKIEELAYQKIHGICSMAEKEAFSQTLQPESIAKLEPKQEPEYEQKKKPKSVAQNIHNKVAPKLATLKKSIKKGNKMLYGIIAGVIAILVVTLFAVIDGASKEPAPFVEELPRINYDSLAQISINEACIYIEEANVFLQNHDDDKFDEKYEKVELVYAQALNKLDFVYADSLSQSVTAEINEQKQKATQSLLNIYQELYHVADELQSLGVDASVLIQRADAIKPYLKGLIETNNNNQTTNEENEENL